MLRYLQCYLYSSSYYSHFSKAELSKICMPYILPLPSSKFNKMSPVLLSYSPLLHLLNASLLYLWLTQFPGLIQAQCWDSLCNSRVTDRLKGSSTSSKSSSATLPAHPDTPLGNQPSLFVLLCLQQLKHILILQNHFRSEKKALVWVTVAVGC